MTEGSYKIIHIQQMLGRWGTGEWYLFWKDYSMLLWTVGVGWRNLFWNLESLATLRVYFMFMSWLQFVSTLNIMKSMKVNVQEWNNCCYCLFLWYILYDHRMFFSYIFIVIFNKNMKNLLETWKLNHNKFTFPF